LADARAIIGRNQNRLGFANANLSSVIENLSAAESVIRDTDMALETVTLTKNQILQQAGTAMLAQANLSPQSVLSLLG
jgi:flagellin